MENDAQIDLYCDLVKKKKDLHSQLEDLINKASIDELEIILKDNNIEKSDDIVVIEPISQFFKPYVDIIREVLESKKKKVKFSDAIILNDKGEVLLLKRETRESNKMPGLWCLPGGHVDDGESHSQACIRELLEETNLKISSCILFCTFEQKGEIIQWFSCYPDLLNNPIVLDTNEHFTYDWVNYEKLQELDCIYDLKEKLNEKVFNLPFVNEIQKSFEIIKEAFNQGLVSENVYLQSLEKASKYGEGKHHQLIEVHSKKGKRFLQNRVVGEKPNEDKWYLEYNKQFSGLSALPVGIKKDEVKFNLDGSKGNWIMKWIDPKSGKEKANYTKEFLKQNAQNKWKRIQSVTSDDIKSVKDKAIKFLDDPDLNQSAAIVSIIANTGLRPGSKNGFEETENRGVSTLAKKNVKIDGDKIHFEFTGKSYKNNTALIENKKLADYLENLIKDKKDDDFIFDVDIDKVRDDFHEKISPKKELKLKDMRTYVATDLARKILFENKETPPPLPEKGIKKAIQQKLKHCFEIVSSKLNNSPNMAKTSYIHPNIINEWLNSLGVKEAEMFLMKSKEIESIFDDEDYDEDVDEYPLPPWWDKSLDDDEIKKSLVVDNLNKKVDQYEKEYYVWQPDSKYHNELSVLEFLQNNYEDDSQGTIALMLIDKIVGKQIKKSIDILTIEEEIDIEKGKKPAAIGEERTWHNQRFKKTNSGWVHISDPNTSSALHEDEEEKKQKKSVDDYDDSELELHVKNTSTEKLENIIKTSPNPKIRETAKKELEHRSKSIDELNNEEKIIEDKKKEEDNEKQIEFEKNWKKNPITAVRLYIEHFTQKKITELPDDLLKRIDFKSSSVDIESFIEMVKTLKKIERVFKDYKSEDKEIDDEQEKK